MKRRFTGRTMVSPAMTLTGYAGSRGMMMTSNLELPLQGMSHDPVRPLDSYPCYHGSGGFDIQTVPTTPTPLVADGGMRSRRREPPFQEVTPTP